MKEAKMLRIFRKTVSSQERLAPYCKTVEAPAKPDTLAVVAAFGEWMQP